MQHPLLCMKTTADEARLIRFDVDDTLAMVYAYSDDTIAEADAEASADDAIEEDGGMRFHRL